ncbi:MAG: HAMP domain-containing histidine kinase, partial [Ferruginibacter sp.]|nr:HAMP domain-containing histidine kinase [Ferruginibacter sp.]
TNDEKGSGLGLILVKDFVTQQGGSISVQSEQGKGTCITFTIPQHIFISDK